MATLLHITTATRNGVKPVESGIRATKYGYNAHVVPYTLTGTWKFFRSGGKPIYSGIFFENGQHMTYHFKTGSPQLPEGVKEGDAGTVTVIGHYCDSDVECFIVTFKDETTQVPKYV